MTALVPGKDPPIYTQPGEEEHHGGDKIYLLDL